MHFDSITRKIYSVDASIFEVLPIGVAIPRTLEELTAIVKIAAKFAIPLIPRGAATGISGGCLGQGLIIDTSKYLNKILKIGSDFAICEPGVIQDHLNVAVDPLRLGPDTSTGDRATLAGMVANNAAGARSLYYGCMVDAVEAVSLLLCNGEIIHFHALQEQEWQEKLHLNTREGEIYRTAEHLRQNKTLIESHFPPLPRRSSGYNLRELIQPFPLNLAKIITGSEGSFGIITSITVKLVPKLPKTKLQLFSFNSMMEAMKAVQPLLETHPISLEMIDEKILHAGISSPALRGKLNWLKSIPKALLIAEYPGVSSETENIWEVRKAGLGLLLSKRSYTRAIAFIEDVSVPPHQLPAFMETFLDYLKSKGKEAGIYGHVGPGCLHIRPYMDIRKKEDILLMKIMMQDVARMLKTIGGAPSGEHGDGLIRSWLNESFFGKEIYNAFIELKRAFDPLGLMNPHKVVNPLPIEEHLRNSPKKEVKTVFHFDGGLSLAADLCNGNGACRKSKGVMCPSFQVTNDEYDTTRARANALRGNDNLANQDLHDILDLCIQCKGCKTECPSEVDMAKMKAEALFHYQEKHGYSFRNALFAHIDTLHKWSLTSFQPSEKLLKFMGISLPLPKLAARQFSKTPIPQPQGKEVVLLSDTFTEFYCPEVGYAAIKVLNALGYRVTVPPWQCCGRPAISKGFLKHAKANANKLSLQLKPYMERSIPIIGLEPSCIFTLFDEYRDFVQNWEPKNCFSIDAFLAMHPSSLQLKEPQKVALHGHCHQKAIEGMQNTLKVLKSIQGLEVIEIPSGCCGMAGSFGYEAEHSAFSKSIGELKLLPFVRNLSEEIPLIASGYSCRTQIQTYTKKKALHLVEWLYELSLNPKK